MLFDNVFAYSSSIELVNENQIASLQHDLQTYENQVASLQQTQQSYENQITSLQQDLDHCNTDRENQKQVIQKLENDLNSMKYAQKTSESTSSELSQKLQFLIKSIRSLCNDLSINQTKSSLQMSIVSMIIEY